MAPLAPLLRPFGDVRLGVCLPRFPHPGAIVVEWLLPLTSCLPIPHPFPRSMVRMLHVLLDGLFLWCCLNCKKGQELDLVLCMSSVVAWPAFLVCFV